jgi:hypothetical protein
MSVLGCGRPQREMSRFIYCVVQVNMSVLGWDALWQTSA